jgi:ABC-type lipoprotein export system ATPase subunit
VAEPSPDQAVRDPQRPGDGSVIVELKAIRRQYGEVAPVVALREVDLSVRSGDWVAVVGASGSGKSSLLNIIGCLDNQTSGTYLLDGIDVASLTDAQRAGLRSRMIGFVFQSFHLLSHRTVVENVELAEAYGRRPRAGRRERALAALAEVGLQERTGYRPQLLSGGERQRVAVARALLNKPELLLCDEPTGNLDSANAAAILDLLAALHATGITVIMITHDPGVASRAQRQVRIADGQLLEEP